MTKELIVMAMSLCSTYDVSDVAEGVKVTVNQDHACLKEVINGGSMTSGEVSAAALKYDGCRKADKEETKKCFDKKDK